MTLVMEGDKGMGPDPNMQLPTYKYAASKGSLLSQELLQGEKRIK